MARHRESVREEVMSDTRQQLLAAAAEEFAREGFGGANVNRISQAAGFSIGTFYNYFPSKRDLMLVFIEEIGQLHVDFVVEKVNKEKTPHHRMEAFFRSGFGFVENNVTYARAILNALNGPDQEFKERLYQVYQPLFRLLGDDILAEGIAQGSFRRVDAETIARLLMILYLGTASQLSPEGKIWLTPNLVADFVLHALGDQTQGIE